MIILHSCIRTLNSCSRLLLQPKVFPVFVFLFLSVWYSHALAGKDPVITPYSKRPAVKAFIKTMAAKHGFKQKELRQLFSTITPKQSILNAISRPYEAKPWHFYRKHFLTTARVKGGVTFWKANRKTLERAEKHYGVPVPIIVAILGVETSYGKMQGNFSVLQALSTLAFDYPKRSKFFTKELEHYLLLTREQGLDPLSLKGSYAGALGQAQFMPSSYRAYAVDFTHDKHIDLFNNTDDAIGSVANYFKVHGWKKNALVVLPAKINGTEYKHMLATKGVKPKVTLKEFAKHQVTPRGNFHYSSGLKAALFELDSKNAKGKIHKEPWFGFNNFYVITRYNTSRLYAMAVYQLSQAIQREYLAELGRNKRAA